MKRKTILLSLIIVLAGSTLSKADLLATYQFSGNSWSGQTFNKAAFSFGSSPSTMLEEVDSRIGWSNMTSQQVGHTFFITEQMDPDFALIADRLTNGTGQMIEFFVKFPDLSGSGFGTGDLDFQLMNGNTDLVGNTLTSISLTINKLTFAGQNITCGVTYGFWGEPIPEPASVLLLGLGGLALRHKIR